MAQLKKSKGFPITYSQAIDFLKTEFTEVDSGTITITGSSPNFKITSAEKGHPDTDLVDVLGTVNNELFRITRFTFDEPRNAEYYPRVLRALLAIAFDKKSPYIEFEGITQDYVKSLLPFGIVPMDVPEQLSDVLHQTLSIPEVIQHIDTPQAAQLFSIAKAAYSYPHMAWVDLFLASVSEPLNEENGVDKEKSQKLKKRLGCGEKLKCLLPLRHATPLLKAMIGEIPEFPAVASSNNDRYYKAAQLPAYRRPAFFSNLLR